jgi:hypothetical protein
MKKLLLLTLLISMSNMVFSQTTGFVDNCDEATNFSYVSPSGGGGFDNTKLDTLKFGYGVNGNNALYFIYTFPTALDLSAPNNSIRFFMKADGRNGADTSFTASIGFENEASVHLSVNQIINLTHAYQEFNFTFAVDGANDFTQVKKVVITMDNTAASSRAGALFITNFSGGSLQTSTNEADFAGTTSIYPNPAVDEATLELSLNATSQVKVTLNDLLGKELMTIAEGQFSELKKEFSTQGLNKGVYTVSYNVNGKPSKSELLMVK